MDEPITLIAQPRVWRAVLRTLKQSPETDPFYQPLFSRLSLHLTSSSMNTSRGVLTDVRAALLELRERDARDPVHALIIRHPSPKTMVQSERPGACLVCPRCDSADTDAK